MKKIKGLIIPLIIIILWTVASLLKLFNDYIIPSPWTICSTAYELIKSGELIRHLAVSFLRVFIGFFITFIVAFPLAILIGSKEKAIHYFEPFLEFMRHIPPIAVIPILILWFGIGETSKLAVIFLATFFPIFLNTLSGVTNYDKKLLEVGQVLGFSNKDKFFKIILPQAVPSIITGMQLGLGYSWRSLMGAELIAASSGIGYMIMDAEQLSRPDIIIVGIFSIGIVGYVVDYFFIELTRKFMTSYGKEVQYGRAEDTEFVQEL